MMTHRLRAPLRHLLLIAFASFSAACGGDAPTSTVPTPPPPPPPPTPGTLGVTVAPTSVSVTQGQSATATVTITRGGSFTGAVDVSVEGAPTGLTTALSSANLAAGVTSTTVTVQAAATLTPATLSLTVRARGTGVTDATAALSVVVAAAPPPPPTGTIALARGSALTITQGQSATSTVTLTRGGGFTGDVALTVEGLPNGVTATTAPTTLTGSTVTATVTVAVSSSAPIGTDGVTIRAKGTGVQDATVLIPVTVIAPPPGSFALSASPAALSVTAGQSGTVNVAITRTNGFAGAVALTTAVPSGVTASFAPASVTGTSSVLTLAVASTMAAGTYTVGIGGTSPGAPGANTTVTLTVAAAPPPPPSGGSIAWTYCGTDRPVFFAVQDGSGPWTRVTAGTDGVFRFDLNQSRGGVAAVQADGTANTLNVYYLTKDEMTVQGRQFCDNAGTRTLSGSVSGAAATDLVFVGFGSRSTSVVPSQSTNWSLANVLGGSRDLVASRAAFALNGLSVSYTLSNLIIRRGVNAATGANQAVLNFGGSEAFTPATANVTFANGGGELFTFITQFATANGTSSPLTVDVSPAATTTRQWRGVPAARQVAGDLHTLIASATPSAQSSLTGRQVIRYTTAVADQTLTFGPALSSVSTSTVAGGGMVRLRSQYTIQSSYDRFYVAQYQQSSNGRINQVLVSRGYLQSGSSYDATLPDLSGVSGWLAAYGLASGVPVTWTFSAQGWSGSGTLDNIGDGNTVLSATTGGTITP